MSTDKWRDLNGKFCRFGLVFYVFGSVCIATKGVTSTWETHALWVGFNLIVLWMLALDLGIFHRKARAVSVKEALIWSGFWIVLALLFNVGVYFWRGYEMALEFLTGYLIEKSLSVDNIFILVLIFSALGVRALSQHRVLFWGILGALLMRGTLILLGSVLLTEFHWVIYLFGIFLIFTGIRMAVRRGEEMHPERNPLSQWARRVPPLTTEYDGARFFVRRAGKWFVTPLLLALVIVESTDLLFAVDSIPAIFAVTQDAFIVYTSNVFAILGLRSLYFVFAGAIARFYYLKLGLGGILTFVGIKMVSADVFKLPVGISLAVIAGILGIAILASFLRARRFASTPSAAVEEQVSR